MCVGFVALNMALCGYAYVDVNTVKKSNDTTVEEETFSEVRIRLRRRARRSPRRPPPSPS